MDRLRYRPFQAIAIAALAALVTACAVFAPLYDRAMQQAVTSVSLDRLSPPVAGLQISAAPKLAGAFGGDYDRARPPEPEALLAMVPARMRSSYGPPILGLTAILTQEPGARGQLIWRQGECDHVTITSGSCPTSAGEVAISRADADFFGLMLGTKVVYPASEGTPERGPIPRVVLRVAGIYRQVPGDYWFGLHLTGRAGVIDQGVPPRRQHDVWLTARDTFSPEVAPLPFQQSTVSLPLDREAVGVDQVLALGPQITDLSDRARTDQDASVNVYSGVPGVAEDVSTQIKQSRVTVPLLMAQLGLLGVVVLWLVLLAVTEQRRPEVALARLRGRGRRGARGLLLGELVPVIAAGVVPGIVIGLLASWVARRLVLPDRPPFELGSGFLLALAVAVLVLLVVTLLAVFRVAREPVETLLRRVPPRRTRWSLGALDAVAIAGCGGIVLIFALGGLTGPSALAAPALLAVVVGLVLAHLVSPTAALAGRRLLARGRVRAGVSVLDAARSPATRRTVAIVTLATALAVFSADALVVGSHNRASAAAQESGAARVADVDGSKLEGVRRALADVDPDGREVTPVVRLTPAGNQGAATLAVDPEDFRAVAVFADGGPTDAQWSRLAAPAAQPIELTGTSIRVRVDPSDLQARRLDGDPTPVALGLSLANSDGQILRVALGQVPGTGAEPRRVSVDVACADTCRLVAVTLGVLPGASVSGDFELSDLSSDAGGAATEVALGPASRWSPLKDAEKGEITPVSDSPRRLDVQVATTGADSVTMTQAWVPSRIPALVTGSAPEVSSGSEFTVLGLDGLVRPATDVGKLARVPASGTDTSLVNLEALERGATVTSSTTIELWFATDDAAVLARVEQALQKQGITLDDSYTLADRRQALDQSTASWSLQLGAFVGGAALLIALLVLVVSAASSWRSRTRDLAALRMSGVPEASLRSMAVAAQVPAVALGVLAGALAGLAGASLSLPLVPLFATAPRVSTLDLGTAWWAVAVTSLAALVVLGLGGVLVGRALAGRSQLQRLRESQ